MTGARSPLHGIPVVIKDTINTSDMPTTGGSLCMKDFVPPDNASVVQRLRDAGAVTLGKNNMDEWGFWSHFPRTLWLQ